MVALKNSSLVDRRCRFCPKLLCCADCRDAHENNKHAELKSTTPKCPLCFKYDLLFDPRRNSAEKAQLACHVVINHLPLMCRICGDKFDNNLAFQTTEPCRGFIKKPTAPAVPAVTTTPSSINLPCDDNNNGENSPALKKLPFTPLYQIIASNAIDKSIGSVGSLHLKHPQNFDSPPELARHTSTPMHLSVVSLQKQHSHPPSIPEFNLKTPSSQRTFDTIGNTWGSAGSAFESRYFTAESEGHMIGPNLGLTNNNSANPRENPNTPTWSSPVYSILKKQLDRQDSADDSPTSGENYRAERSILKSALLSRIDDSTRDSIEKRVRFSDQFAPPPVASVSTTMADTSACDNDIFFEARESLDEDEPYVKDNSPVIDNGDLQAKRVESAVVDKNTNESKINASTSSTASSSSTSRVLMMLLVEKTDDAKGFSSMDLTPLIDSGLKKLEQTAASINHSKTANENHDSSKASMSKATTEITSYTREIDGSLTETSKGCRRRASIKDTFVKLTDRIECITPPPRRREDSGLTSDDQEFANQSDSLVSTQNKSDGLFSAMARVVRSALKKLPAAVTARNVSREPLSANINSPLVVSSTAVVESHATVASPIVHRSSSIKRPRERIDSHDEAASPRDSSSESTSSISISSSQITSSTVINHPSSSNSNNNNVISSSSINNELVVKSPATKRHRSGWYRIRAREPIARMRERQVVTASPRGASRETQRFQQGALSIGDTFLPLPSRAHQSTQTED